MSLCVVAGPLDRPKNDNKPDGSDDDRLRSAWTTTRSRTLTNPSLSSAERMRRTLGLIETNGHVSVSQLIEAYDVSEVTIRKDLNDLASRGLVARIRGGARAVSPTRRKDELAFDLRLPLQSADKQAIAVAAAAMIGDGEAIALDCSTTSYHLALELRDKSELVVVTNGLLVAEALNSAPGVTVVVLGGVLRRASMSTCGDPLGDALLGTHINQGFFGARGLDPSHGLTDLNPDEVRVKRQLVDACERVIGIVDHTKWTQRGMMSFASPDQIETIVTDTWVPSDRQAEWEAAGVRVVAAEPVVRDPVPHPELARRLPEAAVQDAGDPQRAADR
jgi:DeoR/GlpR family transcriptional regulator of sugar metabolism